ncbi:beta-galactosidase [Crepidotus variabilis]|uniref:Beta-galactosidase n=1 Tax=Crepidotus variabilis TaxID=179855 RepID=A0A9P6JW11_9AGAR|nr:beta-galactosidase [Crepidotus variabilis]
MKPLILRGFFTLLLLQILEASSGWSVAGWRQSHLRVNKHSSRQDIVTYDEYSLLIHGERVMIFSGEWHPYRLPVADLYLDVFQKIRSMGFTAVSFYVFWGLLEPKRGEISFEGIRDLQPFFDAAKEADIYLIARPGPYINAETTAGGFPGWGTTVPGLWRTSNQTYVDAYSGYIKAIGKVLADNEITKGGPIILVQSENEYTSFEEPYTEDFEYEKILMQQLIDAGITVPIIHNDASPSGHYTSVDIWGYDSYPVKFDCSHPTHWDPSSIQEYLWDSHMKHAPKVPNAIYEYQGGSYDGWGGSGYDTCLELTGAEFTRIFTRSEVGMSATILNLYMIFGGTNWGNLGHPGVYTSYDYGAAIGEDRTLREKYYELKLLANFLAVSPAYYTTRPQNPDSLVGAFTGNAALKVAQALDVVGNKTSFYVIRHSDISSTATDTYKLTLPTSFGNLTIPSIGDSLKLQGRDSKVHVVDYEAGSTSLLYSTGEIATWATVEGKDVIVLYGNSGEVHETAFKLKSNTAGPKVVSGDGTIKAKLLHQGAVVLQYTTTGQTVVQFGSAILYIVDRTGAFQFWALSKHDSKTPVIVKGGHLMRTGILNDDASQLTISGDFNSTAILEIIAPASVSKVVLNGADLSVTKTSYGTLTATKEVNLPRAELPNLTGLNWKTADTKPAMGVVLYAGDYGYHTGNILWRAYFSSSGSAMGFQIWINGGSAFAYSIWLDSTFIGSWEGDATHAGYDAVWPFPSKLSTGSKHILTILQDHMGYEEDWTAASEEFKSTRGPVTYSFPGSDETKIDTWKVTGNLGGESYVDKARGPLNEGGLYGERQGWHLPGFDDVSWAAGKPTDGVSAPGVAFYRTNFNLDIPSGVDYPLSIAVTNSTINPHYRAQFYVNGYQFGKYVNHIGPQRVFHVPQGIFNYQGQNTLAVSLWAAKPGGAKLDSLQLQFNAQIESPITVQNTPAPAWSARPGAY